MAIVRIEGHNRTLPDSWDPTLSAEYQEHGAIPGCLEAYPDCKSCNSIIAQVNAKYGRNLRPAVMPNLMEADSLDDLD